jgi:hypothetical protein
MSTRQLPGSSHLRRSLGLLLAREPDTMVERSTYPPGKQEEYAKLLERAIWALEDVYAAQTGDYLLITPQAVATHCVQELVRIGQMPEVLEEVRAMPRQEQDDHEYCGV